MTPLFSRANPARKRPTRVPCSRIAVRRARIAHSSLCTPIRPPQAAIRSAKPRKVELKRPQSEPNREFVPRSAHKPARNAHKLNSNGNELIMSCNKSDANAHPPVMKRHKFSGERARKQTHCRPSSFLSEKWIRCCPNAITSAISFPIHSQAAVTLRISAFVRSQVVPTAGCVI